MRYGVKGRTNKNKTTEEFIIECRSTHPDSDYDYSKTIKHRFQKTKIPYLYEIIKEIHGDPSLIYDLEKVLLQGTKEYSYSPESKFGGHTECRTSDFFTSEQIKAIMS